MASPRYTCRRFGNDARDGLVSLIARTLDAPSKKYPPSVRHRESPSTTKPPGPVELELCLHAPGMDALLRAGIGGLASVLDSMAGEKSNKQLPGGPWTNNNPPWIVEPERVVLKFGEPALAAEYLKRLFEYAFRIDDKENAIDLPSTHSGDQVAEVRAHLQRGLMLTFLQHGQSRKGASKDEERMYSINDVQVPISIRPLTSFKHQTGYKDLIDAKTGELLTKSVELPGTLFPGASVRHNKFSGQTKHEGTVAELLAAYFAMIGTLSLPINRGSAVLLIPEVTDLVDFAESRFLATPKSYRDCLITGVGDAALSTLFHARRRAKELKRKFQVSAISAYLFRPTVWASQQKSRVATNRIEALDADAEKIFQFATQYFRPQLRNADGENSQADKKPKAKKTKDADKPFFSHSIVKPLIADNLANRKPWFENFSTLFTRNDPATGKPFRNRLFFEREGLTAMVKQDVWSNEGQKALVSGVHYALFCQFGRISGEFGSNRGGMQNKFQKEFEKWRIQFAGAKTADQFRFAICDLMSRARGNKEIQDNWQSVLPLLSDSDWQHGRDLALLALASYKGKGDKEAAAALSGGEADSAETET